MVRGTNFTYSTVESTRLCRGYSPRPDVTVNGRAERLECRILVFPQRRKTALGSQISSSDTTWVPVQNKVVRVLSDTLALLTAKDETLLHG
jgi:hypothetical protein